MCFTRGKRAALVTQNMRKTCSFALLSIHPSEWNRTRSAAVLFDEKVGEQVLLVCVTLTLLTLLMVGSSGLCAVHVRLAAFALAGGVSVHIAMHGFG